MQVASSNLARAAAQQADGTITEVDIVLRGMQEQVAYDGTGALELKRLNRLMMLRVAELPQLQALSLYDANGNRLTTSHQMSPQVANNADREYFIFHRTHSDRELHIGTPVRSRSTGKWVIPVSRRIDLADGSFGGVMLAGIDIDFFKGFYSGLQIGKSGAIAMVLDNGTLLLRRPFNDSVIGASMATTALYHAYRTQGSVGALVIRSSMDGVTRLNSYRRLDHYPIFVAAALSKDEILAEWWNDTLLHLAGVMSLVTVASVLGQRLVQQIRLRSHAEAELIQANRTLARLAMHDGLTGLANRRRFDDALSNEFSRAARHAGSLALIMLDVDHFKQYNDIYGHASGDECLCTISRAIENVAAKRPGGLVARYGGEEIAVLLPGTDAAGALAVAEKIRQTILALRIAHDGNSVGFVTLSAGVNSIQHVKQSDSHASLIASADRALYEAKGSGRNRVCGAWECDTV